jgi:TP901-1 family phage major tail protein
VTHAESAGRWRELLAGAGIKRASISGRGLFKDAASDALMRETFFDGNIVSFQVVVPDFGTVAGPFQITGLEIAGEHNGEVTYDMSLESAGELTFSAM